MKPINVLIVEDEGIVALEIESFVVSLGYQVAGICSRAEEALSRADAHPVDIVLMDICLKGSIDGIEAAHAIRRAHPDVETIFLTAHMDDYHVDRAIALDPIAYLAKPFNREELRVFLKIATQKRQRSGPTSGRGGTEYLLLDHDYGYDKTDGTLYYCQEPLHLTHKERMLLDLLITRKNHIVDLYTIENHIWPDKTANANTIRTLIKRIREKLGYRFIETIPSIGYRLIVPSTMTGR